MFRFFQLFFVLLCFLFCPQHIFSLSPLQNSSSHICHYNEMMALLHFRAQFTVDHSLYKSSYGYPKTKWWKEDIDCCFWDGLTCDPISGHVIGLDLSSSHLCGTIHHNSSLFQLQRLHTLNLAYNNFNLSRISPKFGHFSYLKVLNLSYSNFAGAVPVELGLLSELVSLDLSSNEIQGEISNSLYDMGRDSLRTLNISHNDMTGELKLLYWRSLETVDIRSNSLQGLLPLPPPRTRVYFVSSNQFLGELNASFCNLKRLMFLDLSYNQLSGKLPNCLGNLSYNLELLDLGSNLFHGDIPIIFKKDCTLLSIHLDNNCFQGKVPRSVIKCKSLQVLNLGNNQLNSSFPSWLDTLPELQVLVLKFNNFQGSIKVNLERNKNPFPKLQILCLIGNRFSGKLPRRYFENFKALMVNNGGGTNKSLNYIGAFPSLYQETLVLTAKGTTLTYKVITILAAFDFSHNYFNGEIPDSVGQLSALVFLDFSHNELTGHIPPSLGNLNLLESLDLSCNRLEGNIPPQLVQLTFLEMLNVSENHLVGPIPVGPQFNTFSSDSYIGNSGLCGYPLPKCNAYDHHQPVTPSYHSDFFDFVTSVRL